LTATRRPFWRLTLIAAVAMMVPGLARPGQPTDRSEAGGGAGCSRTCSTAPAAEDAQEVDRIIESGRSYTITVETMTRGGVPVHRASGRLVWGHKHHIGGTDLRDLGFDRPDYEVNSALVSPQKIWTSL
jgi:hypothetical protein